MAIAAVYDAIHANISHLPAGRAAGYTTGTPDIRWTAADWAAHPGAVRIDQDSAASDPSADVLDIERGAATNAEAAAWYKMAYSSYRRGARPGQRQPALYTSASNVTPLVNALNADGIHSGPALWVANWNLSSIDAAAAVAAAGGPFPVIGVQFTSAVFWDVSMFSTTWLNAVSRPPEPDPPPPGVYRHEIAPGETRSLAEYARERNTTAHELAAFSRDHLNAANTDILETYLDLNAALAARGHTSAVMPPGLVIYTKRP